MNTSTLTLRTPCLFFVLLLVSGLVACRANAVDDDGEPDLSATVKDMTGSPPRDQGSTGVDMPSSDMGGGCEQASDATLCQRYNLFCGQKTIQHCDAPRTVSCGFCRGNRFCGDDNVCHSK